MKKIFIKSIVPLLLLSLFSSSCSGKEKSSNGDSDFDGLIDSIDKAPNDNNYKGKLSYDNAGTKAGIDISFKMDYRDFVNNDETKFDNNFARLGCLLPGSLWKPADIIVNNSLYEPTHGDMEYLSKQFGCSDFKYVDLSLKGYTVDEADFNRFTMAHHSFEYNSQKHEVVFLTFKPTEANEEWASNLDFGADSNQYYDKTGEHLLWSDKQNHKGLDVTCNRIMPVINEYFSSYVKVEKPILFISGYSRGAGVANIIASKLTDLNKYKVFCYTIGTMRTNVKSDADKYNNIFSIINDDDIVPQLPFEHLGYKHYGRTIKASIKNDYYAEYIKRTGLNKYVPLDPCWKNNIKLFGNTREGIYTISSSNLSFTDYFSKEEEANECRTYYQEFVEKFLIDQYYDFPEVSFYDDYYYVNGYNCGASIIGLVSNLVTSKIDTPSLYDIMDLVNINSNFQPIIEDIMEAGGDFSGIYNAVQSAHDPVAYYLLAEKASLK